MVISDNGDSSRVGGFFQTTIAMNFLVRHIPVVASPSIGFFIDRTTVFVIRKRAPEMSNVVFSRKDC